MTQTEGAGEQNRGIGSERGGRPWRRRTWGEEGEGSRQEGRQGHGSGPERWGRGEPQPRVIIVALGRVGGMQKWSHLQTHNPPGGRTRAPGPRGRGRVRGGREAEGSLGSHCFSHWCRGPRTKARGQARAPGCSGHRPRLSRPNCVGCGDDRASPPTPPLTPQVRRNRRHRNERLGEMQRSKGLGGGTANRVGRER